VSKALSAIGEDQKSATQAKQKLKESAMHRIVQVAAATVVLLLTSLGVATAQDPQPMPKAGMMGSGGSMSMMGGPDRMGMMGMMGMALHVEGRIAFLKAELKISEAQTPQWNTFAEALRSNATRMSVMPAITMHSGGMGQDGASMSAPDRLDHIEKMMSAMLETVKATKAAFAPLYAVLTDEQKKSADQLIHGPMGLGLM
jgi:hypothetical protein